MLNINARGKFVIRTQNCPEAPNIVGKILFIRDITRDKIVFSLTDDCRPLDQLYQLSAESNDDGWYDITVLIFKANAVIKPKAGKCLYTSDAAQQYRNYLGLNPKPVLLPQAVGKICILGENTGHGVSFLKQGYYIAAYDDNGYILAYAGYCQPSSNYDTPAIQQRVLNLNNTNRKLYLASDVVGPCNAALEEDTAKSAEYSRKMEEITNMDLANSNVSADLFGSQLNKLSLS